MAGCPGPGTFQYVRMRLDTDSELTNSSKLHFDSDRTEVVQVQVGVGATWPCNAMHLNFEMISKCIQMLQQRMKSLTRTRFNSTKEVCRFETYQNPLGVTLAMFHWTLSATRLCISIISLLQKRDFKQK